MHAFVALAGVNATTPSASLDCKPASSLLSRILNSSGYQCVSSGKKGDRPSRKDDYLEIALPAAWALEPEDELLHRLRDNFGRDSLQLRY